MPDFSAAIALLKKPIEDAYNGASGAIRAKIAGVRAAKKMSALHNRLWQIQKVKTIWNPDRALSLGTIYHPVDVTIAREGFSVVKRVNSSSDLLTSHCIIYGTAGQGKSILMKYLVGKEIRSGDTIPLLCELRNVSNSLEEHLVEKFCLLLDVKQEQSVFDLFASRGKVAFLLDGFDEVDQGNVQSILLQIDSLSFKYPSARIIVTSRPNSECRTLVGFSSANIRPLGQQDLLPFFKKITRDADFSRRLVESIAASPIGIRELVTTPLLATLLAISYRAAHKIPIEFSEFYEELFQVLLVRHDTSKMGWRRKRQSGLTDRQVQQIFEAFCFAVRRKKAFLSTWMKSWMLWRGVLRMLVFRRIHKTTWMTLGR